MTWHDRLQEQLALATNKKNNDNTQQTTTTASAAKNKLAQQLSQPVTRKKFRFFTVLYGLGE